MKPGTSSPAGGALFFAKLPFLLFSAGFFTVTWDLVGRRDFHGFHLKLHQGLFLLAFLSALPGADLASLLKRLRSSPLLGFPLGILALFAYYLLSSPWSHFPLKSFLYSGWLCFNMLTIWGTALLLAQRTSASRFALMTCLTAAFNGAVILVDQVAYRFGYRDGLVGFNQDTILKWGVSRPHAFSSEPSYAAMFLCLALMLTTFAYWRARAWPQLALGFVAFFGCIVTTSRLGWSGLLAGIFLVSLILFRTYRRVPWRYLGASLGAALVAAALLFASTPAQERQEFNTRLVTAVAPGVSSSSNARLQAYGHAWTMFRETHGLGTGLGASFKYWLDRPQTKLDWYFSAKENGAEVVMSTWGQLLAEGGIPALLIYAVAAYFLLAALWRAWTISHSGLALGAFASAILFFGYLAFWVGNIARGDVWVWYALWSVVALQAEALTASGNPALEDA